MFGFFLTTPQRELPPYVSLVGSVRERAQFQWMKAGKVIEALLGYNTDASTTNTDGKLATLMALQIYSMLCVGTLESNRRIVRTSGRDHDVPLSATRG